MPMTDRGANHAISIHSAYRLLGVFPGNSADKVAQVSGGGESTVAVHTKGCENLHLWVRTTRSIFLMRSAVESNDSSRMALGVMSAKKRST